MRGVIKKWGNSLALRVPKALASELGLVPDAPVDLRVRDGQLVVTIARRWTLDELVAGITDENQHEELEFGPPRGREVW